MHEALDLILQQAERRNGRTEGNERDREGTGRDEMKGREEAKR